MLDDRNGLAVEEDESQLVNLEETEIGLSERELYVLGLRLDASCLDSESLEGLERDGIDVGARAWNDESLNCSECKVAGSGGEERLSRGALLLHKTEESFLLSFVTKNRGDGADESDILSFSKDLVDILERAEHDIGEERSKADGRLEVDNRETVLAGLDGLKLKVCECSVDVQQMKLLLGDDCVQ